MSVPTIPYVEIRQWTYPDTLEKMLINDLIKNNSINAKRYLLNTKLDPDIPPAVIDILNMFEVWGYVTSELVYDAATNQSFRVYTVSDFFNLMVQERNVELAASERRKLEEWNRYQQELAPEDRFGI